MFNLIVKYTADNGNVVIERGFPTEIYPLASIPLNALGFLSMGYAHMLENHPNGYLNIEVNVNGVCVDEQKYTMVDVTEMLNQSL